MPESLHWSCSECGEIYSRDEPRTCAICGNSIFKPVEIESAPNDVGKETTDEFDIGSELERLSEIKDEQVGEEDPSLSDEPRVQSNPTEESNERSNTIYTLLLLVLLSVILIWFFT
nr:hypothetical protein [Haloferax sp. BAB-2207]